MRSRKQEKFLAAGIGTCAVASLLGGCATAPKVDSREVIAVRADTLSARYSSINARVRSESVDVDHRFVASLDPNVETVTRLESAYTQRFGSGEESVRVGD